MCINVQLENPDRSLASGTRVSDKDGGLARSLKIAWQHGRNEFPFVTSIDPYGDTLFNYLMTEALIAELERLTRIVDDDRDMLVSITGLGAAVVENAASRLFLAFVGD